MFLVFWDNIIHKLCKNKRSMRLNNAYYGTYLKQRASTQKYIKCLQVILIRKDLNYAIHQIELSKLIFTIDNLAKKYSYEKSFTW